MASSSSTPSMPESDAAAAIATGKVRQRWRSLLRQPLLGLSVVFILVSAGVAILAPAFQAWGWLRDPRVFLDYQPHVPPSLEF
ncbi:MAG: hypothetical protein AAFY15_15085, partial [Cyanobacteria bacterium J06648_11]